MLFRGIAYLSVEILSLSTWQYLYRKGKELHSADEDLGELNFFFAGP